MARLPDKSALSGPDSLRSGRKIAVQDTTAIGAGISSIGAGLTGLGEDRKRQEDALGLAKAEAELNQGLIRVKSEFDQDPDYSTFRARAPKATGDIVKTAAQYIPDPNLRERWVQGANTEATRLNSAIDAKADVLGKQATITSIDETLEAQRRIYVDPNTTEEEKQKALSDIQGTIEVSTQTGIFTPDQAAQRKQLFVRDANFSRAKLLAKSDPGAITKLASTRVGQLVAAKAQEHGVPADVLLGIGKIESNLNPRAKAKTSSASGIFQFINDTGKRYGITDPFDAEQNADAGARFTRDNINGLRRSLGRDPTPGEIYLAHFSGLGAAQKLGNASDDTPTSEIFSAKAIEANPSILAGKTAGDVRAWAERKMAQAMGRPSGGETTTASVERPAAPVEMPAWYNELSPEERQSVLDIAEAEESQRSAVAAANLKATQVATRDEYSLRIATNDPTLTPQDILSDTRIDNGDKAALINTYNTARKDAFAGAAAVQAFANGTLQVDPYSTEGRKAVDFIGSEIEKSVPAERQQSVTESLVRQTGLVPQNTFNSIRAGLESQNVSEVVAAAQMASRISQISPPALSRRDGGATVQSVADDFGFYVNTLNLSPEQAAQKIIDMRDPAKQRERKALAPAAKEFIKQIENEDIGSMFDESWLPFSDPKVGFNEAQALGMQAEYQAIAEEQFYQANGNPELAKNRAQQEMKRLYGVTELTGSAVVMKHPPEKYWPKNTAVSGDPFLYAKQQLFQDLYAIDPEIGRANVQLVTTPETDAMIKRGEMPAYAVFYTDKNGVLQTMPGKLWRPDLSNVERAINQQREDDVESAREQDEYYRETVIPGQDRDATLDRFLDGDPLSGEAP